MKNKMKKFYKKAFTMMEALVVVVLISIIGLISIPQLLPMIKDFSLKENVLAVEQAVKEARSLAIKKSSKVYIDFSQASSSNGGKGGLLSIKKVDGTQLQQMYLDENVLYDAGKSTIESNVVIFDYQGRPIDSAGDFAGFTALNNTVAISYYSRGNVLMTKYIKVSPLTGNVSKN